VESYIFDGTPKTVSLLRIYQSLNVHQKMT